MPTPKVNSWLGWRIFTVNIHLHVNEWSSSYHSWSSLSPSLHWSASCCFRHWESISSFHDGSLHIENSWAMESCEAPTLEFIGMDSTDKHGSFIPDTPHEPCLNHTFPELVMLSALSIHEGDNYLLALFCKKFKRLIVDAYVYHKHIRFCACNVALTLQLKLHWHMKDWWWDKDGTTNDSWKMKFPWSSLWPLKDQVTREGGGWMKVDKNYSR
jgi:hypothetical protein